MEYIVSDLENNFGVSGSGEFGREQFLIIAMAYNNKFMALEKKCPRKEDSLAALKLALHGDESAVHSMLAEDIASIIDGKGDFASKVEAMQSLLICKRHKNPISGINTRFSSVVTKVEEQREKLYDKKESYSTAKNMILTITDPKNKDVLVKTKLATANSVVEAKMYVDKVLDEQLDFYLNVATGFMNSVIGCLVDEAYCEETANLSKIYEEVRSALAIAKENVEEEVEMA